MFKLRLKFSSDHKLSDMSVQSKSLPYHEDARSSPYPSPTASTTFFSSQPKEDDRTRPRWRTTSHRVWDMVCLRRCKHPRVLARSALLVVFVACLAIITWLSLILTVANRLRIPQPTNGLTRIVQSYHAPNATSRASPTWMEDFSTNMLPVSCHSHNDYWHRVPLYEGLAAGCASTEADIWYGTDAHGDSELFVGHKSSALSASRTLRSLYLDPLVDILTHQNAISSSINTVSNDTSTVSIPPIGVFSMVPNTTVVLLLDFKTGDDATWNLAASQLEVLRFKGWLTHWTPETGMVQRPVTIVGSGETPFDKVIANTTYRDIFFDAPLIKLSDADMPYNSNNSYYASVSLGKAVGSVWTSLSSGQRSKVEKQVQRASDLGLKSRYWDTPSWPVGKRNRIWQALVDLGASVLNVDDLTAATRWDWQMCVVGGLNICNK